MNQPYWLKENPLYTDFYFYHLMENALVMEFSLLLKGKCFRDKRPKGFSFRPALVPQQCSFICTWKNHFRINIKREGKYSGKAEKLNLTHLVIYKMVIFSDLIVFFGGLEQETLLFWPSTILNSRIHT